MKTTTALYGIAAGILIAAGAVAYDPVMNYFDPGVRFCKEAAKGEKPFGDDKGNDEKMSEQTYRDARSVFADSRDEEIKKHGTALMDAAWNLQNTKEEDQLGVAFASMGSMMQSINGLTGACAKHGYTIKLTDDEKKS